TVNGAATKIGTATVHDDLTWDFTPSALEDGEYAIKVQIQAIGADGTTGRVVSSTTKLTVNKATTIGTKATIDAVADDVSTNGSTITADLKSGISTDDTTPELSGTIDAELVAGEVLSIYNGTTKLGEATVTGTGWTFTPTALAKGAYSFTAQVENVDGETGSRSPAFDLNVQSLVDAVTIAYDEGSNTGELGVRYVMMYQNSPDAEQEMRIGEVEVWDAKGNNVALNATVVRKTGVSYHLPDSALWDGTKIVDGVKTGEGGYAASQETKDNWVQIDLGGYYNVNEVKFYERFDKGSENVRHSNIGIFLSANDMSTSTYTELEASSTASLVGVTNFSTEASEVNTFAFTEGTVTDDTTPTLSGKLDVALGTNEELAVYDSVNGAAATRIGKATV
ncbi:MAG: Ig-like domain-containing protein, partial [Gammaproteobacteria bacterium]|nr:Ig-like domain-containing protein [Gammaproteobacteria bacterium]